MSEGYPFWAWLFGGLALSALETLVPGAFLIWIGLAGLVVGLADYLYPLPFEAQTLAFAVLAAALALIGKRFYGSVARATAPALNRAQALVGREFALDAGIVEGYGRIRVGDSVWRVTGPDLPAGARVRVSAVVDGVDLRVESV